MSGEPEDADRFMVAIFPSKQYLESATLREAVAKLANSMMDGGQADPQAREAVQSFHPITMEQLKQKPDIDAYGVMGIYSMLVRTRFVTNDGFARSNPPPDDYLCDSCHTKGWLKKEFQDSKIDGANVCVWLCPACLKLEPEQRDIRF
jgi:hypothetical protein